MGMRRSPKDACTARDLVAVAVGAGKGSQEALRWALEKLVCKEQFVILLHVRKKITTISTPNGQKLPLSEVPEDIASIFLQQRDKHTKEIFLPLRCICNRRRVQLKEVVLDDIDVSKAIVNFAKHQTVDKLILGASSKNALVKTFWMDLPAYVSKNAPDFCSVYVISKGRIYSHRLAPNQYVYPAGRSDFIFETHMTAVDYARSEPDIFTYYESARSSPLVDHARKKGLSGAAVLKDHSIHSTASCHTPSMVSIESYNDYSFPESLTVGKCSHYSSANMPKKLAYCDESMTSFESKLSGYSYSSTGSSGSGHASLPPPQQKGSSVLKDRMNDLDMEISRLKLQLKQSAILFEDAQIQKQGAMNDKLRRQEKGELHVSEMEMHRGALQERQGAYGLRKYNIEEIQVMTDNFSDALKITEGVLGTVYRSIDNNAIVIKILRSDFDLSTEQFELEVARLSRSHHPNVMCFNGICLEIKCLVCEHSFNGFLEDHLFIQPTTPPIPWQDRLQIAVDIASGLHFLQEFRADPLDLKPDNILLTLNFTAKLFPFQVKPSPDRSAKADPKYRRTGSTSVDHDVYALGIIFLQLITAAPPAGLAQKVHEAMEIGRIGEVMDRNASEWPLESVKDLAKLALRCTGFVGRDPIDLGSEVLPELNWLHDFYL